MHQALQTLKSRTADPDFYKVLSAERGFRLSVRGSRAARGPCSARSCRATPWRARSTCSTAARPATWTRCAATTSRAETRASARHAHCCAAQRAAPSITRRRAAQAADLVVRDAYRAEDLGKRLQMLDVAKTFYQRDKLQAFSVAVRPAPPSI